MPTLIDDGIFHCPAAAVRLAYKTGHYAYADADKDKLLKSME